MRRGAPALALAALAAALAAVAAGGCSGPARPGPAAARPGAAHARHARAPVRYYLALGDSLSQGVQPDSSGVSVRTGLAAWRDGLGGRLLARGSELAVASYNAMLARVYRAFGVRVADVSGAFRTAEFEPRVAVPGQGTLPRNVAAICRWTWECAPAPRGPNEHPNGAGYQVIARTFLLAGARP